MNKTTGLLIILIMGLGSTYQQPLLAQDTTKAGRELKNTIHFNVTNPVIFGSRSLIFGYERILNKHQSFTVNIGQANFPSLNLLSDDSIRANRVGGQEGFHLSGDYRFYLAKQNKYTAPRGVYVGPYFSYNLFKNKHRWELKNSAGGTVPVESQTRLIVNTLGIEMGYQFVFWKRFSLDMILVGPGIATYNLKTDLGTNLSEADKQKLFEKLNEALADKFPGYSIAIDQDEFMRRGSTNKTDFGFRYMIQVGFRF